MDVGGGARDIVGSGVGSWLLGGGCGGVGNGLLLCGSGDSTIGVDGLLGGVAVVVGGDIVGGVGGVAADKFAGLAVNGSNLGH